MERDDELDRMAAAFDGAGHGRGSVVLVGGEPGVGKTRLVGEFLERIAGRARVFQGACDDLMAPRALGPFRDIVRQSDGALGRADPTDRDGLVDTILDEFSDVSRPAVLVVEDIHWADQASADVLCLLARRIDRLPAIVVLTFRDERSSQGPVPRVSAAVAPACAVHLALAPLSDAAVAELAADAGHPAAQVVRLVGGNPFFLGEILSAGPHIVPTSIIQAVSARLSELPPDTRAAVDLLSLVPTGAEHDLVAALIDPVLVEPAERAGVLSHAPHVVRFRHELARRAVAAQIPPSRAESLHRRILAALIELGADPSRVVHHAVGARDQPATARFAGEAARAAARADSHREAAAFAELALGQPVPRTPAEIAALHRIATDAYYAMNEFGSAQRHADRTVVVWQEAAAPAEQGEALLVAARLSTMRGHPRDSMAAATRAVALLRPGGPSRALALALASVGSQHVLRDRLDEGLDLTAQGLQMAEAIPADDVVCYASIYHGFARSVVDHDSGLDEQRRAVDLAGRLGHWDYLTVAAQNLAVTHLRACRIDEAAPLLDLAAQIAGEHDLDAAKYRIDAQRAYCLLVRGEWARAEQLLRVQLSGPGDPGVNAVNPLAFLGRILARRGDPDAGDLIGRAWQLAADSGEGQKTAVAAMARLEWLWLTGRHRDVTEFGAQCLELAVRIQHRLLRAQTLRQLRRAGRPVVPFAGCPPPYAAGIAGHHVEAAGRWQRAGDPYEQALELTECRDRDAVTRGLDMLDRLGAEAAVARRRHRLGEQGWRGLPRGRQPSTRAHPANLTRRQAQVLELVAAGLTNGEIAARLVLSERTVDNHVSAVLRALGVSSRREAARHTARREGSPPTPSAGE